MGYSGGKCYFLCSINIAFLPLCFNLSSHSYLSITVSGEGGGGIYVYIFFIEEKEGPSSALMRWVRGGYLIFDASSIFFSYMAGDMHCNKCINLDFWAFITDYVFCLVDSISNLPDWWVFAALVGGERLMMYYIAVGVIFTKLRKVNGILHFLLSLTFLSTIL